MEMTTISEAKLISTPEGQMRPLLFGEKAALIHLEVPPKTEVPPHAHPGEGLVFCLSGTVEFETTERTVTCTHGSAVLLRANEVVGMRNSGPLPAELLLISAPPAVRSFEELERHIHAMQKENVSQKRENPENTR